MFIDRLEVHNNNAIIKHTEHITHTPHIFRRIEMYQY